MIIVAQVVAQWRALLPESPRAGGLDGQLQALSNSEVFPLSPPGFASCRVCLALVVWLAPLLLQGRSNSSVRLFKVLLLVFFSRPLWVCAHSRLRAHSPFQFTFYYSFFRPIHRVLVD